MSYVFLAANFSMLPISQKKKIPHKLTALLTSTSLFLTHFFTHPDLLISTFPSKWFLSGSTSTSCCQIQQKGLSFYNTQPHSLPSPLSSVFLSSFFCYLLILISLFWLYLFLYLNLLLNVGTTQGSLWQSILPLLPPRWSYSLDLQTSIYWWCPNL